MLYTLRGIRRGFWTAFPANQLVLPLPADVITSGSLHHDQHNRHTTEEDSTSDVRRIRIPFCQVATALMGTVSSWYSSGYTHSGGRGGGTATTS